MKLYKYTPHNKCYKYDIIKKCELWFAKFSELNDPVDSNLAYRKEYSDDEIKTALEYFAKIDKMDKKAVLQHFSEKSNFIFFRERYADILKEKIGVLCLSQNPKNILMWSHYANAHKGIVYEFETKDLFSHAKYKGFSNAPDKMDYVSEYELLSYAVIDDELTKQCEMELLTKAQDWAYEKEYRYIDLQKSGAKNLIQAV